MRKTAMRHHGRWLLACILVVAFSAVSTPARAVTNEVLVLSSSVSTPSPEVQAILDLGFTARFATDDEWAGMSTSDFSSYRAIVIGDATCSSVIPAVAVTTAQTWGAAITGNAIINGTDAVFHDSQGGNQLTQSSVAFATSNSAGTGLYASLSCYFHDASANTPVPLLSGIGTAPFSVTGVGCYDNVHIVANHPAVSGLSDTILSNWGCSVHEAFDSWPAEFQVLAMARDIGQSYTAPDGTVGTPYILARGAGLTTFPLMVTPSGQSAPVGTLTRFTASLHDAASGLPIVDQKLSIKVETGPNAGAVVICEPTTCNTSSAGEVQFNYFGNLGTDVVVVWVEQNATESPDVGEPQVRVSMTWTGSGTAQGYAALGDSYSSGEGTSGYLAGTDSDTNTCHRGIGAYPLNLAKKYPEALGDITFRACSGAVTDDFFAPNPTNSGEKAQLAWLGAATQKVTFTIGGNDAGFADVINRCVFTTDLWGSSQVPGRAGCSEDAGLTSEVSQRIGALAGGSPARTPSGRDIHAWRTVISKAHLLAPNAQIYVAGYPQLFGNFGPKWDARCKVGTAVGNKFGVLWPVDLFVQYRDAQWMDLQVTTLNSRLSKVIKQLQGEGVPVTFVNVDGALAGHRVCDRSDPWINGVVFAPGDLSKPLADSFHPTFAGQRAYADTMTKKKVAQ